VSAVDILKNRLGYYWKQRLKGLLMYADDPDLRSMILHDWQTGVFAQRGSVIHFFTQDSRASVTCGHCKYNTT